MRDYIETVHGLRIPTDHKTNPSHYEGRDGTQVISLTESCGFCEGNVIKYTFRAGKKAGESRLDDLLKARWYLDRLIERER